jgi:hypothetical protein
MEARRNPDLEAKITSLATQQGRDRESLVAGLRVSAIGAPGLCRKS